MVVIVDETLIAHDALLEAEQLAIFESEGGLVPVIGGLDLVAAETDDVIDVEVDDDDEFDNWHYMPDFVEDDMEWPLFRTTVDYTLDCVAEWAKYKANQETHADKQLVWKNLSHALAHSELLQRMIEGHATFTEQPLKMGMYNWYELLEYGEDIVERVEFSRYENGSGFSTPSGTEEWAILNGKAWKIIDKTEGVYTITPKGSEVQYTLRKATKTEQDNLLHPRQERDSKINSWIVIRQEEESDD